jgi:hypothetical protein
MDFKKKKLLTCMMILAVFSLFSFFFSRNQIHSSFFQAYRFNSNDKGLFPIEITFFTQKGQDILSIKNIETLIHSFRVLKNHSFLIRKINALQKDEKITITKPLFNLLTQIREFNAQKENQKLQKESSDQCKKNLVIEQCFPLLEKNYSLIDNSRILELKKLNDDVNFSINTSSPLIQSLIVVQILDKIQALHMNSGFIKTPNIMVSFGFQERNVWKLRFSKTKPLFYLKNNIIFYNSFFIISFPLDKKILKNFFLSFRDFSLKENLKDDDLTTIKNNYSEKYTFLLK